MRVRNALHVTAAIAFLFFAFGCNGRDAAFQTFFAIPSEDTVQEFESPDGRTTVIAHLPGANCAGPDCTGSITWHDPRTYGAVFAFALDLSRGYWDEITAQGRKVVLDLVCQVDVEHTDGGVSMALLVPVLNGEVPTNIQTIDITRGSIWISGINVPPARNEDPSLAKGPFADADVLYATTAGLKCDFQVTPGDPDQPPDPTKLDATKGDTGVLCISVDEEADSGYELLSASGRLAPGDGMLSVPEGLEPTFAMSSLTQSGGSVGCLRFTSSDIPPVTEASLANVTFSHIALTKRLVSDFRVDPSVVVGSDITLSVTGVDVTRPYATVDRLLAPADGGTFTVSYGGMTLTTVVEARAFSGTEPVPLRFSVPLDLSGNFTVTGGSFSNDDGTAVFDGSTRTLPGTTMLFSLTRTGSSPAEAGFVGGPIALPVVHDQKKRPFVPYGVRQEYDGSGNTTTISFALDRLPAVFRVVETDKTLGLSTAVDGDPAETEVQAGDVLGATPIVEDNGPADAGVSGGATYVATWMKLAGNEFVIDSGILRTNGDLRLQGSVMLSDLHHDLASGEWNYVGDGDTTSDVYCVCDFGPTDYWNLTIKDDCVLQVAGYAATVVSQSYATIGGGDPPPPSPDPSVTHFDVIRPELGARLGANGFGPAGTGVEITFAGGVDTPVPGGPPGGPTLRQVRAFVLDGLGGAVEELLLPLSGDASASAAFLAGPPGSSSQLQQTSPRVEILASFGSDPFTITAWNPDIDDFGATQIFPGITGVTDFSPYDGDPESGGAAVAWFARNSVFFLEYDASLQGFGTKGSIDSYQFAGASGGPMSAFRREAGGQTLFVTDGSPGELWSHPGGAGFATKIGNLGNEPRQIRFWGEIGVVSNFGSGTLTIVRWQDDGTVTILGTVDVGDGSIGLHLRLNATGNIEILSTGFHDHTYTLTVISPTTGGVVGTPVTRTVPEGGLNPVHALFVNEEGTRVAISCNGSDEVLIFDLPTS